MSGVVTKASNDAWREGCHEGLRDGRIKVAFEGEDEGTIKEGILGSNIIYLYGNVVHSDLVRTVWIGLANTMRKLYVSMKCIIIDALLLQGECAQQSM